jgi:beta-galactosidase
MSAAPVPATSDALTAPQPAQHRTEIPAAARFAIGDDDFLLDGVPFQILSGALHYFRVHPQQWADRIAKARQMGLNTIETYVAWNAHAPTEEAFDLTGGLDLGHFLDLIADAGMHAIVRPGPYICAEWANGGLPAWLFRDGTTGVRRDEPAFMAAVRTYFRQLAPVIIPRQISHGGPIILMQVENEYGAYGADKDYLRKLVDIYHESGIEVPLTTVDQPVADMLANGGLPELHKTGSFGSRIAERLDELRRHQPTGPLMCAEFWNGWFDEWGGHHHQTADTEASRNLDELLSRGASVNIYMFHGGTNFGFTNGANDKGTYRPIITSYDYDAPLDEGGNPTAKYWAYRDILRRYATIPDEVPASAGPAPTLRASFSQQVPLWQLTDRLGTWTGHDAPPTADEIGHYAGFTLYRAAVAVEQPCVLHLDDVRDRAQVFLDRHSLGVLDRDHHDRSLTLPGAWLGDLDILVEDLGRVDYGPRLGEHKGIVGAVTVDGQPLRGWRVLPLELDDIAPVADVLRQLPADPVAALAGPVFARATFDLPAAADLFLDTRAWGKGVAWINGFCLGRYWSRGPQGTLYLPAPTLRETGNELIVLELHATPHTGVRFVPSHDLGPSES